MSLPKLHTLRDYGKMIFSTRRSGKDINNEGSSQRCFS